ncbi:MAG: group II truncated hemoglobin [Planctomycetota bacterium]|nr:group II truncated hemoglobin [Planctomycetota bacterium]
MPLPINTNPSSPSSGNASDDAPSFGPDHTPYDTLGGDEAVRRLVDTFYDTLDRDERFASIRALHQRDLTDARQKLYEFLSGWLGGPQLYIEKYGHPRLKGRHMPFPIGDSQRDEWLGAMNLAMDAHHVEGEIRTFLEARFNHVASFMRNQEGS